MKLSFKIAAIALVAGFAAPAFADSMADPATMTCKDLMKMDMTGMMDAGKAIHTAMMADAKMAKMTDEETMKAAETACKAHGEGTVMEAMHM